MKNDSKYSHLYDFDIKNSCFTCLVCKKNNIYYSSKKQTTISEHCARKHSGRIFKCNECDKIFESESSRKQHIKNKHEKPNCYCPFPNCSKKPMKNDSQVQIHYGTIHYADKWKKINNYWKCLLCDSSFKSSTACAYHVSACFIDSPFSKKYNKNESINNIPIHFCKFKNCRKDGMSKSNLRRHYGSFHCQKYINKKNDVWVCDLCDKELKSKEGCSYHVVSCFKKENLENGKILEDEYSIINQILDGNEDTLDNLSGKEFIKNDKSKNKSKNKSNLNEDFINNIIYSDSDDEQSNLDDEQSNLDDEQSNSENEQSDLDDEQSDSDDEQSDSDDEQSDSDDEQSDSDDEQSDSDDEQSDSDDEQSDSDEQLDKEN